VRKNSAGFIQIFLVLIILILAVVAAYYFGVSKNKTNVVSEVPTASPVVSIEPTLVPTVKPTTDPTVGWKTYTNEVFSIKLPESFDYDQRFSSSPSNMHITWSDIKNGPPKNSINIDIGYVQGDPKIMSCKTNEECWQIYEKSFAVSGYNNISYKISGEEIKGFEAAKGAWQLYPMSHNDKGFVIDIQFSAPTLEETKQLVSQVNQILSTFKFTN